MSLSRFVKHVFEKYPIISNSIIYGTLCVGAEFSQQTINRKVLDNPRTPFDTSSINRYAIYGSFIGGPIITVWYRFLDRKLVGTTRNVIIKKLLIDQFTFTPSLLVVFFIAMSFMEKRPDLFDELKQKFAQTFTSSCMFWMPAQTINFKLIPPSLRVVYIGTCSFAWVNILCYIKRQ